MSNRISREELVKIYKIELSFFDSLQNSGLLNTETEDEVTYLLYEELPAFEKYATWHYDLEVNIPGIEIISHLLAKMEALRLENLKLKQNLR